jgi:SAM-dependent methyltransferase
MTDAQQERRRRSFEAVAERYLAARPPYPAAALDIIVARITPPADVLEVGPGPGLATLPMAQRGYRIVAVELGERLAAEARRNLEPYRNATVVHAAFETWEPARPHSFDLVLAASSWHWVDPALGYDRAHRALRESGWLALMANHPRPGRLGSRARRFWDATDSMYRRHAPGLVRRRGWNPSRLPDLRAEIAASGSFHAAERHVIEWRMDFSADAYLDLIGTYSDHATLPARSRARLFRAIHDLARREFGGVVPRYYRTTLFLARAGGGG